MRASSSRQACHARQRGSVQVQALSAVPGSRGTSAGPSSSGQRRDALASFSTAGPLEASSRSPLILPPQYGPSQLGQQQQPLTHGQRRNIAANAVSVPKVLCKPPGQKQMEWVDLWESYTYQKVVFVKEPVTEDSANNLIALTLHLDSIDQKRIYYWLNCPGGEVSPTLALYDTMQYVRSKTATVCYGVCLGMGGFLLTAGGEKGYRFAMPHSILMMHHPSGSSRGQASEMHIESRELVRTRDYLSLLVSDATGQPYDRVIRELSRNKWMDPQQAIEYGMIDKVLTTPLAKQTDGPKFKFQRSAGGDASL